MTLQAELDAMTAQYLEKIPEESQRISAAATRALQQSGLIESAIGPGDALPPFELPNQDGDPVRSAELLARGPLVVTFFRGVWCPYCMTELDWLQRYAARFAELGAGLVAIAPQNRASAAKTRRDRALSFDVLSDRGNAYARQLGIVFEVAPELKALYRSFGLDIPQFNGDESWTLPMPTRLLVDTAGRVRLADITADYTRRSEPEQTLDALRALGADLDTA